MGLGIRAGLVLLVGMSSLHCGEEASSKLGALHADIEDETVAGDAAEGDGRLVEGDAEERSEREELDTKDEPEELDAEEDAGLNTDSEDGESVSDAVSDCPEGEACTLTDPCSAAAVCLDGECVSTGSVCDDGLFCTEDFCEVGVCENVLQEGNCVIDGVCLAAGAISPADACEACVPTESVNSFSPKEEVCNGKDDNCDGWIDEGCEGEGSLSFFPLNPTVGQSVLIRLESENFLDGVLASATSECGSFRSCLWG